jgi:hypothetical protein
MKQSIATQSILENPSPMRASEVLRGILVNNPGVELFTIRRILRSIDKERVDLRLMLVSLPAIVPVNAPNGTVAVPASALGYQMLAAQQDLKLPRFILKKSVSRRSLAVAIHSVLPMLEAAEKLIRPRWAWVSHRTSQRVLGLFVLLLALAVGFPLLGFTPLHATSIFVIALGMAEKDGLAVLLGVVAGVVSLAVTLSSVASARAMRSQSLRWLRKLVKRAGISLAADKLEQSGHPLLANALRFQWSQVFLGWNPEGPLCPPPRARKKRRRRQDNSVPLRAPKSRTLRLAHPNESIEGARVLRIDERRARVGQKPGVQAGRTPE